MDFGIFGNRGSGKTTLAVFFARLCLFAGWTVKSNMNIVGSLPLELTDLIDLDSKIQNEVLVCDEIYTMAESRISTSKLNRFMGYVNFQARKMHRHIVYTAQLASSVDLRFTELTDLPVMAASRIDKKEDFNYCFVVNDIGLPRMITYDFADREIFPYFNTDQRIRPFGLDDMIAELEKDNPKKLNQRINNITEFLMKKLDWSYGFDRALVEDRMLEFCMPLSLSKYVYNRLKTLTRQEHIN